MANYYSSCRTNYFRVKDPEQFKADMKSIPVDIVHNDDCATKDMFMLYGADDGGWPSFRYTTEEQTHEHIEDLDIFTYVADRLADGQVAIFMEVGAEKLRYLIGQAVAINNKRQTRVVDLNTIYKIAQTLAPGSEITRAEY